MMKNFLRGKILAIRSLRGKILLLLTGTALMITFGVAVLSERGITRTVSERERHAVHNIMRLASLNVAALWSALLDDKILTVRAERARLMEIGVLVRAILENHAQEAETGFLTREQAQTVARDWVNRLPLENQIRVLIYDRDNRILSSTDPGRIGKDISGLQDFKGRPLANTMREESLGVGHSFAIYAEETARDSEARFAYFGDFGVWGWTLVVSDSARTITRQIASQKAEMEAKIHEILSPLVLTRSGFLFILTDDGRFIIPPPRDFLEKAGGEERARDVLRAAPREPSGAEDAPDSSPRVFRPTVGGESWRAESTYFRPLAWTLTAMVSEADISLPARQLVNQQAALSALILCLSLLCAFFFAARIVRPLTQLTRYARALPEQDFLSPESGVPGHIADLPDRSRDEIGLLAAAFLFMDQRLRENIRLLVRETVARERIESELDIARSIQLGLLPTLLPASFAAFLSLEARMLPAREVGGDLYDYFMISERELCVVIGDVSGKGVPAALFMAISRTLVRSAARDETDPGRMMRMINNQLAENNPNLMFVTLFLAILDCDNGELRYVNAGHPPPILITKDGAARRLEGRGGPACGVLENASYRASSVRLAPGEILLGYTDGITEAVNGEGEQYGEARLLENMGHPARNAQEAAVCLLADIEAFTAGTEPFDDITLIAVQLSSSRLEPT
ncbi:MAG: SpoIIE family protein phosphatase [Candidatus Accumulibacter sp.]|jgi:sigma-B regulation protein RsbU (phosphoserine phosphatase)|nr:SpoIIE family protein phosphatase [Accumulibacter sp.]